MGMRNTKLSELAQRKGKLLSPLVDKLGDALTPTSWSLNRLPEYLWLALILDSQGRADGISCCVRIINKIRAFDPDFDSVKLSFILSKDDGYKSEVFDIITSEVDPIVLAPLTAVVNFDYDHLFYDYFYSPGLDYGKRINNLESVTRKYNSPDSNDTTDLRFIAIIPQMLSGHLHIPPGSPVEDAMLYYGNTSHDEEIMRIYRPSIRSLEGVLDLPNERISDWVIHFWNVTSRATDCKLFSITYGKEKNEMDYRLFIEKTKKAIDFHNIQHKQNTAIDDAYTVLTGLLAYAFKLFSEVIEHDLGNTLIGRQSSRIIVEVLIMMKYLASKESEKPSIWTEYKAYGIGKYKLILMKLREGIGTETHHVSVKMLDLLVNELKIEEFTDIDLRYFDDVKIRDKAIEVGEKNLYDVAYDYDSSYAHGLWGAVRESSMLVCDNVFHHFRPVADATLTQELLDVTSDCFDNMVKIISLVNKRYNFPGWYIDFLGDINVQI